MNESVTFDTLSGLLRRTRTKRSEDFAATAGNDARQAPPAAAQRFAPLSCWQQSAAQKTGSSVQANGVVLRGATGRRRSTNWRTAFRTVELTPHRVPQAPVSASLPQGEPPCTPARAEGFP